MDEDDLKALLLLQQIPGVGPIKLNRLLAEWESPTELLEEIPSSQEKLTSLIGSSTAHALLHSSRQEKRVEKILSLCSQLSIELLPYWSQNYPLSLCSLPEAPPLLYLKGSLPPSDRERIAIIGTRGATLYGQQVARQIATDLARRGYPTISGLARGIDTCAHRGTLEGGGKTFAIIGSGHHLLYPKENHSLAEEICAQGGGILSEYPPDTPPDRIHFPQRNRIVSGLSHALLLVEAPLKSGALNTMAWGKKQGKSLYAIPGRIDSSSFEGNHLLLKNREASLCLSSQEIVESFTTQLPQNKKVRRSFPELSTSEKRLFEALPGEELTIDQIAEQTRLPINMLHNLLLHLVLKKVIIEYPGKIYKKVTVN